jgi:hypothetical protein
MERAHRIAFLARRLRLLSERQEFLTSNRAELIERILSSPVPVGELDRSLILHASELDRLCAHAVCVITRRAHLPVLDVLAVLSPDRLSAMYYALPENRRGAVRRDLAWAYHVEHAPPGIEDAIVEFEQLADLTREATTALARLDAHAPSEAREQTENLERTLLRSEVGL